MRINSILSLGLAAMMAVISCEKQPVLATGDAVVGFETAEFNSGMGSEYIRIPIVTTGESSVYPIKVYIEAGEYNGAWAANEDVDYFITSKEILIASPDSKPSVEVKLVNPGHADELNFRLVIAGQENAQSVGQKDILVKCVMSELDRVCGKWKVSGTEFTGESEEPYSETWTISNVGGRPVISGMCGYPDGEVTGYFDGDNKLTFYLGEGSGNMVAEVEDIDLNDGSHYDKVYLGPVFMNRALSLQTVCKLEGTINESHDRIVWSIPQGYGLGLLMFTYDDYMTPIMGLGAYPIFIEDNTIKKVD